MSLTRCIVCRETHANQSQTCPACVERVDAALAEILSLHELAASQPLALTAARRGDGPGGTGGTKEPPAPCDVDALTLSDPRGILFELERWEVDWHHEFDLEPYMATSTWRQGDTLRRRSAQVQARLDAHSRALHAPRLWLDWLTNDQLRGLADALSAREGLLRNELAALEAQAAALSAPEDDHERPAIATLHQVLAFLRTWWPQAAQRHPAADEFAHDVLGMLAGAWAALGAVADDNTTEGVTVTCPADIVEPDTLDDEGNVIPGRIRECGHVLRLDRDHIWASDPQNDRIRLCPVVCKRCGTAWSADRLIAVWRTSAQAGRCWVDADVAARQLGVDIRTIRAWGRRPRRCLDEHEQPCHQNDCQPRMATRYGRYDISDLAATGSDAR